MKKKIIVITGIIITLIVLIVFVGIWSKKKREWIDSVEQFGPMNVMELDENAYTNSTYMLFSLDTVKDFQIKGRFTIREGEVEIVASLNGDTLFTKSLNSEVQTFESDIYPDKKGEIKVDIIIPDDAKGDYSVTIRTRETNLNRLIRRIKD